MAYGRTKLFFHKVTNWEYWPVYVVYFPTLIVWVWWSIRFRSIKFYKYANPAIKNGGLHGVSKFEIYNLLPKQLYPKTILIRAKDITIDEELLVKSRLNFPLIAKPDNGKRGRMVQKIHSIEELTLYRLQVKRDFLLQEIIHYENEIGLFYCRLPNNAKRSDGCITGITLKKFLEVTGDGLHSIEFLLKQNPRFAMQIAILRNQFNLQEILPCGQRAELVPYGNHNRGTMFLDGRQWITPNLEATFSKILGQIEGFNYGRLDIRFRSFEELERGEHFSIIELNGAMSEPTHIYDPKCSFLCGQREIFRHQFIFRNIIKLNKGKSSVKPRE